MRLARVLSQFFYHLPHSAEAWLLHLDIFTNWFYSSEIFVQHPSCTPRFFGNRGFWRLGFPPQFHFWFFNLDKGIANELIFTHFQGYSSATSIYRSVPSSTDQVTLILLTHRELSNLKVSLYPLIQSNRVGFVTQISEMRFELITSWFVAKCSIQLSYPDTRLTSYLFSFSLRSLAFSASLHS